MFEGMSVPLLGLFFFDRMMGSLIGLEVNIRRPACLVRSELAMYDKGKSETGYSFLPTVPQSTTNP